MKKVLLIIVAVALCSASFAQKGKFALSGDVGYGTSKYSDGTKTSSFNIAPSADYFVSDKISVGLRVGYEFDNNVLGVKNHKIGFGIHSNYYLPISDNFFYTPGIFAGISKAKGISKLGYGFGLDIVKFEFRPVERIGITFSLGSVGYDNDTAGDKRFDFYIEEYPNLGFKYYF